MNTRFSNTNLIEMDCEVDWSNLPNELWRKISKFLDTRMDVVRVRAVCESCQSSVSPPVISLKLPFPSKSLDESLSPPFKSLKLPKSLDETEYLPLVKRTIYKIQACEENPNPWTILFGSANGGAFLFQVEEEQGISLRLLTPLSGYPIQPPTDPKGLNFLSSGLSQICTYYYYKSSTPFRLDRYSLRKVVVSCSNPSDYAVMAMDYGHEMHEDVEGAVYFYKSGEHAWSWIHLTPESKFFLAYVVDTNVWSFSDIITYKGKFYALECRGTTILIDPYSKLVSEIAPDIWPCSYAGKQIHLVESLGHLLLVDRQIDSITDDNAIVDNFKVYKLNEEEDKWVEIETLGDQALFVSNSVSFSVSARDYVGYKEDCIYYYSDQQCHPDDDDRGILVMFSLEDASSQPLQQGDVFF